MRLKLFVAVAMLSANLAAHADSLGTGVTLLDGNLTASVNGNSLSAGVSTGSVTNRGYSDTSTSTTTGAASSSGIQFTFTQMFASPDFSTGGSGLDYFFTPTGAFYSITDPDPAFDDSGIATDSFDTDLFNLTTGATLYDTSTGGSLTGALVAGDYYLFTSQASVAAASDPSLTYAPSILFTTNAAVTPEPSGFLLLGTGLLGIAGMMRRRAA